jgi:hypothetical protein
VTQFHHLIAYFIPSGFLLLALWSLAVVITNRGPGEWFWRILAVLQVIVGIQIIAGLILLISGKWPANWRHFVYGAAMPLLLLWAAHRLSAGRPVLGLGENKFQDVPWAVFGIASFIAAAATFMAYLTGPS